MLPRLALTSWAQAILPPQPPKSAGIAGVSHCTQPPNLFRTLYYPLSALMLTLLTHIPAMSKQALQLLVTPVERD